MRCATSEGRRERRGLPCPFSKIEKKQLDFGKSTLFVCIYGIKFSFKIKFSEYLGEKIPTYFPSGPCLKKFLVARLYIYILYICMYLYV